MKNSEIRTIRRKPIWMGALALIIVMVLAFGTAPSSEQAALELPENVDLFDGIQIEDQQVPLVNQEQPYTI